MNSVLSLVLCALAMAPGVHAKTAPDATELTKLLKDFLAGASHNDAAMHDRFWAEDLIYTGSSGRRIGKADIMRDVRSAPAPKPGEPTTIYSAEDIRIHRYDNTAVVAFRLVATTATKEERQVARYLNTGTFLERNGKWQVVGWQATRLLPSEVEAKRQVAAAEAAFHQAMLTSNIKKLESLTDESFIWTDRTGEQMPRQRLLDNLGSGRLRYSKLVTGKVTVSMHGDAAVVRGVSMGQRSAIPDSVKGDPKSFTDFYTVTFVDNGGAWKALAMHTSRR